ncbi:MAG: 3'-5' exonuclease [Burkholderia vietnamiensis]|nr:3'-5' exonuclease [Burkholderia vietnamiensis]
MAELRAAWFSRHDVPPDIRAALHDYAITQVNPPGRGGSARDVYQCIATTAGFVDLIIYIGPRRWVKGLLFLMARNQPKATLIMPIMESHQPGVWAGDWRLLSISAEKNCVIWSDRWTTNGKEPKVNRNPRDEMIVKARRLLADRPREMEVVILDTETTGIDLMHDEPVEIALIDTQGRTLFNQRIKPTVPISDGAARVHGISLAALENAPSFEDVHVELRQILHNKMVVGWNVEYDLAMLENAARHAALSAFYPGERLAERPILCAMKMHAAFYGEWNDYRGEFKWQRLERACDQFGIEDATIPGAAHSALGDVWRTLEVLRYMGDTALSTEADDEPRPGQ